MANAHVVKSLALFLLMMPFVALGGIIASIIMLGGLERHLDANRARTEAIRAGALAFGVLALLSLVAAAVIPYLFE